MFLRFLLKKYLQNTLNKPHKRKSIQVRKFGLFSDKYLNKPTTCIVSLGAIAYLSYRYFYQGKSALFVPNINAAVLDNKRKQFNFVADVVEKTAPALVYIEIKDARRVEFFSGRPVTISNGSGFIIKEDGLILTNAHVVTNKPHCKVEVRLYDGSTYIGTVENVDLNSDLATVRISAKNLPALSLGDSATLRPGEFVVAMGSPLSLSNTVTFGVISSTHRPSEELGLHGRNIDYLQTDAAITFGNSGGPLVNLDGEAIGVNSMKVTTGISFAIPSDYVKKFLATTQVPASTMLNKRLYMGITMLTLTPQILEQLHYRNHVDIQAGVLVWKVIVGSPAYTGGLQPGDIVTQIDGQPVTSANDVYAILAKARPKPMQMLIYRNGESMKISITPESGD